MMETKKSVVILAFLVGLISFWVYTLNANSSPTSDSLPNNFTAINVVYNGRLDITNFRSYFLKRQIMKHVAVENNENKLYAKTPIINGILASPFFLLVDKYFGNANHQIEDFLQKDYETYYQSVGKYYGSLLAALSVLFVFLTLHELFKKKALTFLGSLAYAFGTSVYSTAAQGNWQHGPSLLLITASYYFLSKFLEYKKSKQIVVAAILLALAFLIRPVNLLFFVVIMTVIVFHKEYRKLQIVPTLSFIIIIIGWFLFLHLLKVPGGYNNEIFLSFTTFNLFYSLKVIASLLFSPNVGLFFFSPIFVFSFLSIFKKDSTTNELSLFLIISSLSFLVLLVFNSIWWAWEGGYSWGPRLLTEGSPFLIYLGGYFFYSLKNLLAKIFYSLVFLFLFFYSLFIHTVGVYAFDTSWQYKYFKGQNRLDMAWYNSPNLIDFHYKVQRIFFNQKIIRDGDRLKIEKKYYLWDRSKIKLRLIKKELKFL